MATVVHDPTTGLLAIQTETTVQLLDAQDLAIAGTVLIRLACTGRTITPELVLAAIGPATDLAD
jgi:hypothetical protein